MFYMFHQAAAGQKRAQFIPAFRHRRFTRRTGQLPSMLRKFDLSGRVAKLDWIRYAEEILLTAI